MRDGLIMWIKGYVIPMLVLLLVGAGTSILFLVETENRIGLLEALRRAFREG